MAAGVVSPFPRLLLALACAVVAATGGPDSVPSVEIAPGVRMPALAFGTARTSLTSCTVEQGVATWLRAGGRHLDTADDYGTQPDVGRALAAAGIPRSDVFITTKVPGPIGRTAVVDLIMGTALPQLQVDHIDLVLIHFPCRNFSAPCTAEDAALRLETWRGLRELRDLGKIRAAGVSNFDAAQVDDIVETFGEAPAVNQVQFHLGYHDETLLAAMKKAGTTLEAWASLGGPTVHGKEPTIPLGDARLKAVAARYNASTAQVVFSWEARKGVVPVTATCNEEHAQGDLAAFGVHLNDDDQTYLDGLAPAPEGAPGMIVV